MLINLLGLKRSKPIQTDATSHNIVSPTMLGVVDTCCMVHANRCNNCQHCWWSSKEVMYSGTVILNKIAMHMCRVFTRPRLLWFHANRCNIVALHFASHRIELLGLVASKFDRFQTICNKCQHCYSSM